MVVGFTRQHYRYGISWIKWERCQEQVMYHFCLHLFENLIFLRFRVEPTHPNTNSLKLTTIILIILIIFGVIAVILCIVLPLTLMNSNYYSYLLSIALWLCSPIAFIFRFSNHYYNNCDYEYNYYLNVLG